MLVASIPVKLAPSPKNAVAVRLPVRSTLLFVLLIVNVETPPNDSSSLN